MDSHEQVEDIYAATESEADTGSELAQAVEAEDEVAAVEVHTVNDPPANVDLEYEETTMAPKAKDNVKKRPAASQEVIDVDALPDTGASSSTDPRRTPFYPFQGTPHKLKEPEANTQSGLVPGVEADGSKGEVDELTLHDSRNCIPEALLEQEYECMGMHSDRIPDIGNIFIVHSGGDDDGHTESTRDPTSSSHEKRTTEEEEEKYQSKGRNMSLIVKKPDQDIMVIRVDPYDVVVAGKCVIQNTLHLDNVNLRVKDFMLRRPGMEYLDDMETFYEQGVYENSILEMVTGIKGGVGKRSRTDDDDPFVSDDQMQLLPGDPDHVRAIFPITQIDLDAWLVSLPDEKLRSYKKMVQDKEL